MPTRSKMLFPKFGHRQELRQTVLPPYEKCVSVELVHYLDLHSLQSGLGNSTLMVSLLAYILHDVDRSHIILLSLHDISAAFDTVDHTFLLDWLSRSSGIVDSAFLWFHSFLTDRTVSVVFGRTFSPCVHLSYGLPQGSVIAPLLFILYTYDLSGVLRPLNVLFHQYANATLSWSNSRSCPLCVTFSGPIVLQFLRFKAFAPFGLRWPVATWLSLE
jgi:hypothetical protein